MPKQKTRRSAAKRFRLTGTGKIRRNKANHSHMLIRRSKSAYFNIQILSIPIPKANHSHMLIRRSKSAKRKMRQPDLVDASETKRVRRMIAQ